MTRIILPELGEGIVKAQIVRWNVQPGTCVKADDDIVELVTDKAVFNVPAPQQGVVTKIFYGEGQEVLVGAVLAEME